MSQKQKTKKPKAKRKQPPRDEWREQYEEHERIMDDVERSQF